MLETDSTDERAKPCRKCLICCVGCLVNCFCCCLRLVFTQSLEKMCDTAVINIALAIPNINFRTPNSKPIKENVLTNILINYTKKIGSFIGNCNVFAAVLSLRVELTKIKSVLIIKMMSLPTNQKIKTNQILME